MYTVQKVVDRSKRNYTAMTRNLAMSICGYLRFIGAVGGSADSVHVLPQRENCEKGDLSFATGTLYTTLPERYICTARDTVIGAATSLVSKGQGDDLQFTCVEFEARLLSPCTSDK